MVKETRLYPKWTGSGGGGKEGEVGHETGIMAAQLELNKLHKSLADEGFNQVLYSLSSCVCVCVCEIRHFIVDLCKLQLNNSYTTV